MEGDASLQEAQDKILPNAVFLVNGHQHPSNMTNVNSRLIRRFCPKHAISGQTFREETKRRFRFVKGWFWRMYPRSGFRSGGTCEPPNVQTFRVFVLWEHLNVPSFWLSFRGNIHHFVNPHSGGTWSLGS